MDTDFPRGRGAQVEKSWTFQGVGVVLWSPLEWKFLEGGESNWKKNLRGGGGGGGGKFLCTLLSSITGTHVGGHTVSHNMGTDGPTKGTHFSLHIW